MDQEKYIKLFNYGYFLSKHEPKILEKLLKASKENEDMYGPLKAGEAEYKMELNREKLINKSKDLHKDRGYER